jgi:hypothetical protein
MCLVILYRQRNDDELGDDFAPVSELQPAIAGGVLAKSNKPTDPTAAKDKANGKTNGKKRSRSDSDASADSGSSSSGDGSSDDGELTNDSDNDSDDSNDSGDDSNASEGDAAQSEGKQCVILVVHGTCCDCKATAYTLYLILELLVGSHVCSSATERTVYGITAVTQR